MDWDFAIERHRVPLLGIVLEQFAEMGLTEGGAVERLSKPVYRYALRLLRKAESAVRRLIFVAARNIVIEPEEVRPSTPRQKASPKQKVDGEAKPKRKRGRCSNCSIRPSASKRSLTAGPSAPKSSPASLSSIPIRGFPCSSGLRLQPRTCCRGESRRRHRQCGAPDPPSHGHHGCAARHPAPRDAARTLAGPSRRRAPSGALEPLTRRPAAGIPPAGKA